MVAMSFAGGGPADPLLRVAAAGHQQLPLVDDRELHRVGPHALPHHARVDAHRNVDRKHQGKFAGPRSARKGKNGEGKYTIFVCGNLIGTRLGIIYKDLVPLSQVAAA